MTKLIVNADDMGFSEGVNTGIISAYRKGIVTSCTIMPTMPAFEDAVSKIKENPLIGAGVHLTLSAYEPLLKNHKTIVNNEGMFYRQVTKESINDFKREEVLEEFIAQIEKVKATGINITHLDSHHHLHRLFQMQWVMQQIVDKYKLPIRGGLKYTLKNAKVIPLIDSFYKEEATKEFFQNNIEEIKKYETVELMCHPAWVDGYLLKSTSYSIDRAKEYDVLISEDVKEILSVNDIKLINYSQL